MQTVEITGTILEEQGRCTLLAGTLTLLKKVRKLFRITTCFIAKPFAPLIGQRHELRIDRGSKLLHDLGQRIIEILILALTERVARHLDARAESMILSVIVDYLFADI